MKRPNPYDKATREFNDLGNTGQLVLIARTEELSGVSNVVVQAIADKEDVLEAVAKYIDKRLTQLMNSVGIERDEFSEMMKEKRDEDAK